MRTCSLSCLCAYLFSMAMVYYNFLRSLAGESSSYRWKSNKVWIYQSLSELKYKRFFSKGKRTGKGVRQGKARRWSVTEVDRSRTIFFFFLGGGRGQTGITQSCFLRTLCGSFWSENLEYKCNIKHVASLYNNNNTNTNTINNYNNTNDSFGPIKNK